MLYMYNLSVFAFPDKARFFFVVTRDIRDLDVTLCLNMLQRRYNRSSIPVSVESELLQCVRTDNPLFHVNNMILVSLCTALLVIANK